MALTYLPATKANAAIKAILTTAVTYYTGLNTASPGLTGANEVTGGSYARKLSKVTAAATGKEHNATAMTFTGMPAVTVDYFSEWSAVSAGTYECGGATTSSLTVPAGSTVAVAVAALTFSVAG